MLRATQVRPAGPQMNGPYETITLDHTARHRRRMVMKADGGLSFLLDLEQAQALRHGDGLVLEDGRVIKVLALPEPLTEVRGRDSTHLIALAYQIGNRHLEAQIEKDRLVIRQDHVISDMLKGLGASVVDIEEVFEPEAGAYGHHH
jgi:urease accessory protein